MADRAKVTAIALSAAGTFERRFQAASINSGTAAPVSGANGKSR